VIRTAPEGRWFIVGAWLIVIALATAALRTGMPCWWIALGLWMPIAIWVVAFFRDPVRDGIRGDQVLTAPADGKVVSVVTVDEPTFIQGRAWRVAIFMNVFDCHVNRYPIGGTVAYRQYNPGKFGHAAADKASLDNEQSSIGLETPRGKMLVRQIAGLVARRIVTDHAVGTRVSQGDRLGMIRFGSRVDLFFPLDAHVTVQTGDTTRAGITVVAEWP
jgi:phosphatidylserine decarboxylase